MTVARYWKSDSQVDEECHKFSRSEILLNGRELRIYTALESIL